MSRQLHEAFGDQVLIICIHLSKFPREHDPETVSAATTAQGTPYPILHDPQPLALQRYAIRTWQPFFLINPNG